MESRLSEATLTLEEQEKEIADLKDELSEKSNEYQTACKERDDLKLQAQDHKDQVQNLNSLLQSSKAEFSKKIKDKTIQNLKLKKDGELNA